MLVNELRENVNKQLETVSQLPPEAEYTFDSPFEFKGNQLYVQKTVHRTVVSLNFSKFQAKEVIRERKGGSKALSFHSPKLMTIVPPGARYAYDLIAFVGRKTYLEGRKLKSIHVENNREKVRGLWV